MIKGTKTHQLKQNSHVKTLYHLPSPINSFPEIAIDNSKQFYNCIASSPECQHISQQEQHLSTFY